MNKVNKKQIKVLRGLIKELDKEYDKLDRLVENIGDYQEKLGNIAYDLEDEIATLEYEE